MATSLVCYVSPVGGIDDRMAKALNIPGYSKEHFAALRSLYELEYGKPIIDPTINSKNISDEEMLKIANKLAKFKNSMDRRHLDQLRQASTHTARSFMQLYQVPGWTENTRTNRINAVVAEFSAEVSRRLRRYAKEGVNVSREEVISGRKSNGKFFDGQISLFNAVFDTFLQKYVSALEVVSNPKTDENPDGYGSELVETATHRVEELGKLLANWPAVCTFARISLRDVEGLKLGNNLEYAAPTTPDNFTLDEPLENYYDVSESVKDAWMQRHSQISAFGSLGAEVRRFLSTIDAVDDSGKTVKDDLGYTVKVDPLTLHNYLQDELRGITSESGMIAVLKELSIDNPQMRVVFKNLAEAAFGRSKDGSNVKSLESPITDSNHPINPTIITQILEDMHKVWIPYTALVETKNGIIAKRLDVEENPLYDEYVLRMSLADNNADKNSVYNNDGSVNWENLARWMKESRDALPTRAEDIADNPTNAFAAAATGFWSYTRDKRASYLVRASEALGVPLTFSDARKIVANKAKTNKYVKAIQTFRTKAINANKNISEPLQTLAGYYGIKPSVDAGFSTEDVKTYEDALARLQKSDMSFEDLRKSTVGNVSIGEEQIKNMLHVVADVGNRLRVEKRVPWFDRKGKVNSRYLYRTPCYMADMIDRIHAYVQNEDGQGLRNFMDEKWGHSTFFYKDGRWLNNWMQLMYDSVDDKGKIKSDSFATTFEVDEFLGSNLKGRPTIFENFTDKQHTIALFKQYLQPKGQNRSSKLGKYPSFILGDSGVQMFFTAPIMQIDEIKTKMKDIFKQELEHHKYVEATNKVLKERGYAPIDNYSETADRFTQLSFLNPDVEQGKYWKILTKEDSIPVKGDGTIDIHEAYRKATQAEATDALSDAINTYMEDAMSKFKDKLVSMGVLERIVDKEGKTKYYDKNNTFARDLANRYQGNIENMVEDFYWNTKFATIQQLQMFTVDPAFYDIKYPIKDLQKRYKEIYAPGKGLSLEARGYDSLLYASEVNAAGVRVPKTFQRVVYFNDVAESSEIMNPAFMRVIEKTFKGRQDIIKAYKKNTLTDGQGYRTLDSYRAVKGMAGEWSPVMEEAYKRIKAIQRQVREEGRELTPEMIQDLSQYAVVLQPIKPYYFGLEQLQINDNGDAAYIPVQHKYAEIVLIPELMNEGKLKEMAIWMENHEEIVDGQRVNAPIDMICSTKCVKVGAFGAVDIKTPNTVDDLKAALSKAAVHNLNWQDYRIQSGVPEHLNQAQLFGTQPRKLILEKIDKNASYASYVANIFGKDKNSVYIPGIGNKEINGKNLIALYNSLIMANIIGSYNNFAKQVGTVEDLSNALTQMVIANSNQSSDNAFAFSIMEDAATGAKEFVDPLFDPILEHDSTATVFSMLKKEINKQKIKGGSAVQASPFGLSMAGENGLQRLKARDLGITRLDNSGDLFEVVSAEGNNVLYDEIEMPWNLSYKSVTGKEVALKFEDWCNPDGTLKMSDKIVYGEDAKEYMSWPVAGRDAYGRAKDLNGKEGYSPQGYYVPLIETKYKGILDMIYYRIPTERMYSMINGKVFRFTHPMAGGVMKVPSSRTTTAGFDFDIDKLYFFMRDFAQQQLSRDQIYDIWNSIYRSLPKEFMDALKSAKEADELGSEILDVISDQFGNSDLFKGIKERNEQLKSEPKWYRYWDKAMETASEFAPTETAEEAFTRYLEDHRDLYPVFDTYNPEVSPLDPVIDKSGRIITPGNTRAARNNLIIDLMRQRLMDVNTMASRYTPGGFENHKEAALTMRVLQFAKISEITSNGKVDWKAVGDYLREVQKNTIKDPEPEYDASDPTAILVYNQQNQIAAKLIGIFANHNTNHVYASTMYQMSLVDPIRFGNHTQVGLTDMLNAPDGVDVDKNIAELLAASVDAVKDPVLNFLNLNTITADAAAMLTRLGYTPTEIGLLFNQPIVKEACDFANNNGTNIKQGIVHVLKQYGGNRANLNSITLDPNSVSTNVLADNIIRSRRFTEEGDGIKSDNFKQGQLQVLKLFKNILDTADDLNSFVQATRFTASNSMGSTWGDLFAQQQRVKEFIDKYSISDEKAKSETDKKDKRKFIFKLTEDSNNGAILNIDPAILDLSDADYMATMSRNPFGFEQCMMDQMKKATDKVLSKYYPYYNNLYTTTRDVITRLSQYGRLNAETINSIHKDLIAFILSKQIDSPFNGSGINERLTNYPMTNREYYVYQYPTVLQALQKEGILKGYRFFDPNTLHIVGKDNATTSKERKRIVIQGVGGLNKSTSNALTNMWADAVNSDEVVHSNYLDQDFSVKDLALDYFYYNFYRLAFNFHPTSGMSLSPTIARLNLIYNKGTEQTSYIETLLRLQNDGLVLDDMDIQSFAKQEMLNHLDTREYVFEPKAKEIKDPIMKSAWDSKNNSWNSSFTLDLSSMDEDASKLLLLNDNVAKARDMIAFMPIIALEKDNTTVYYMAESTSASQFNYAPNGNASMKYRQVKPLGTKGVALQFLSNAEYERLQTTGQLEATSNMLNTEQINERISQLETEDASSENIVNPEQISTGVDLSDMFTDKQWALMIEGFKQIFPDAAEGKDDYYIKSLLSDTSRTSSVEIMKNLVDKLNKGELTTIVEDPKTKEKKEIKVCK